MLYKENSLTWSELQRCCTRGKTLASAIRVKLFIEQIFITNYCGLILKFSISCFFLIGFCRLNLEDMSSYICTLFLSFRYFLKLMTWIMNMMWFAISSLHNSCLIFISATWKVLLESWNLKCFLGEGRFLAKAYLRKLFGDQRPFDNILKKLIQGYRFCCFPWSNRYKLLFSFFQT